MIKDVKNIFSSVRRNNRKAVDLSARLEVCGQMIDCTVCDISLGGARLKTGLAISSGTSVFVRLKDTLNRTAKVVWTKEGFIGLNFDDSPDSVKMEFGELAANLN